MDTQNNSRIEEFLENFSSVLDEKEQISGQTIFKELNEWSSITLLSLMAMVDEEYNVSLSQEEIKTSVTLEDLFNLISKRKLQ
jgi:acyl carrier protein